MAPGCPDLSTLERYVAGDLDARGRRDTEEHVAACAACDAVLADVRENLAAAATLRRATTLPPISDRPQPVGGYRILRELGRGGMGVVYEAEDPALGRRIALKRMRAGDIAQEDRRRFRLEARMLAALESPYIVTVHSLEEADGHLFITMELVSGPDLGARLREGPMPVVDAVRLALHLSRALAAAHARGVTHQDLKPANVVLAPDGTARVLDFGLARAIPKKPIARIRLAGTPGYMSPEQARGEPSGPEADVWALGCILFECLAGVPLFADEDSEARLEATRRGRVDLSRLPDDTPAEVRRVIDAALSAAPAARPSDAVVISAALEEALDTLEARPMVSTPAPLRVGNLPVPTGSFVGRRLAVLELRRALRAHRLVTLQGIGGSGKTRLAIETATSANDRYPGGVWLIDLAYPREDAQLIAELAILLGVQVHDPDRAIEPVARKLDESPALVLVDNCEASIEACATVVAALLAASTTLRVLATSREPIQLPGECVQVVPPLALAPPGASADPLALHASEAERLFVERAQAADAGFRLDAATASQVAAICRALDGMPLAIELAAAQVATLGLDALAARLHDRFGTLTGTHRTPHERHRTLRASIDWSHDRLTDAEQRVLHALGVFEGGAASPDAIAVSSADDEAGGLEALAGLCRKSLIRLRRAPREPRYELLETIREYAVEHLRRNGREGRVRDRHAERFVWLAETAEPELVGPDQTRWLDRLEDEHANFRAALRHLVAIRSGGLARRLAGALGRFWHNRGHWTFARRVYADVLALGDVDAAGPELATVLLWDGCMASTQGDYARARASLERCERIAVERGDRQGIAKAANALGGLHHLHGETVIAAEHYTRALEIQRALGNRWGESACLNNLAGIAQANGALAEAEAILVRCLAIRREVGDRRGVAMALNNLGKVREERGDASGARAFFEECREVEDAIGDPRLVATSLTNLGRVTADAGDLRRAHELLTEGLEIRRRLGDRWEEANSHDQIGDVARRAGRHDASRDSYFQGLAIRMGIGHARSTAESLRRLAVLDAETGEPARAARLLGAAERAAVGLDGSAPADAPVPPELDRAVEALGAEAFEAERRAGRALSTGAAVRLLTTDHGRLC